MPLPGGKRRLRQPPPVLRRDVAGLGDEMDIEKLNDMPPWEWPEEAGEFLLEILRDSRADAEERTLAAELAGECVVMNDEVARELLSIALDAGEPEALREKAAIALGPALEDASVNDDEPDEALISPEVFHQINESLRKLYMDAGVPNETRRRALEASVRAPQDWHRDEILSLYSSNDERWKLTAVFCMRFVKGFDRQILEALQSDNEDIRYEAVIAAGQWGTRAAWPHIAKLLKSKKTEKELLLAAIEAAPYIHPGEAAKFIARLMDSRDGDIAEAAEEAMDMTDAMSDDDGDNFDGRLN